jgi:hypothetical protein
VGVSDGLMAGRKPSRGRPRALFFFCRPRLTAFAYQLSVFTLQYGHTASVFCAIVHAIYINSPQRYFARNFWNASCSITTFPNARSFFRPSFCFSSSFLRRLTSLACSLARTSFR